MKYKVPVSYQYNAINFTYHRTWKDAYKHSKRRGVPMYCINRKPERNEYMKKRILERFVKSITPFLHKLKKRKK